MYPSSRRKKSSIPKSFPPNISLQSTENIDFDGRIVAIRLSTAPLWKALLRYLSYILSCFILYLLNLWIPSLYIKMALTEESEPEKATHIIIYGADNHIEVVPLIQEHISDKTLKVFHYRLFKYYLEEETLTFKPSLFNLNSHTWSQIHDQFLQGLDEKQVNDHTIQYGENMTDIPKKSCLTLLVEEIITPFYIFQVYSFIIWYIDYYYIYTYILIFMTVISVGITLYQTMQTRSKLQQLSHYEIGVKVHRRISGEVTTIMISSAQLVPGDLMEIPEGVSMPCDALLLKGSCIMNEAMLTGESIPVSKHPLPCSDVFHNPKDDRQHILFSGTKCIYTRHYEEGPALALVISTGFDTLKGGLVRTMLFPKKLDVGFQTDSYKFIFGLAIMGLLAFIIDLGSFTDVPEGTSLIGTIIIKGSELLTVSIPPALPTCIQIGISVALAKLNKHRIFCISPNKINDAGRVNIMCFDKTGTLTEENLDLLGVRPVDNNPSKKGLNFFQHALDSPKIGFADLISDISKAMADISLEHQPITHVDNSIAHENRNSSLLQILEIMASCHSLTLNQNTLIGDPLDIKMFEATGWTLEMNEYQRYDKSVTCVVKPPVQHEKSFAHNKGLAIYRQFEFSSKLQRMSVVLKAFDDKEFQVHIKGSPEKIRELCKAETVPENFHSALQEHTQNGYRVLACATRILLLNERQIAGMKREEAEKDFTFVGFLVMENKLKPPTTEIINILHSADIKSIMVTGDDALTALSIARQCHIIGNQRKIYLGDISAKSLPGKDIISWKDFDLLRQAVHRRTEIQERRSSFIAPNELILFEKDHIPSPELEHASILIDNEESKHNLHLMSNRDSIALVSPKAPLKSQDQEQHHQGGIPSYNFIDLEDFSSSLSDYENCCFAITGKAFSQIVHEAEAKKNPQYRSLLHLLLNKCLVFARMNPDEKELLVKLLSAQKGNIIGMCGDGANDVRALKAAHVGISLSEAEASIAAPFTSNIQDITCVPRLLREGRAALVTSYQAFKYMILFAVIFTVSLGTIYHYVIEAPDWQYYHFEIFIVLPLSTTMTMSKTSDYLSKQRPTGRLISVEILSSVIGQGIIQAAFIIGTYALMMNQPWYDRSLCVDSFDSFAACTENTTTYILTIFQYTMTAWVFLAGKPFKKPFYTNYWFTFSLIPIMIVNYLVAMNPFDWKFFYTASWAVEVELPMSWRQTLFEIIIVNSIVTVLWEKIGVELVTKVWKRYKEKGSEKRGPELYVSLLNIK